MHQRFSNTSNNSIPGVLKKRTKNQLINYARILWQMEYIENMHTLILRCKNALHLRTDGLIILYSIGLEIEYI